MDEYEVVGVKTTIPFFRWLLRTEAFATGAVDTTFLDATLAERDGRPFVEPSAEAEDLAVIGAAVHMFLEANRFEAAHATNSGSEWRRMARRDALRA